jgi:RHS repeat-associated protein
MGVWKGIMPKVLPCGYPFGEFMVASGDESDYQFTGKERDGNTGLDYFPACPNAQQSGRGTRYCDASIGRWLSVDPLADFFPDITPYHYYHNNPINRIDLHGLADSTVAPREGDENNPIPGPEVVVEAERSSNNQNAAWFYKLTAYKHV